MKPHEKVAENVRAETARKGMKQYQVAAVLEISQPAARLKLNGTTPITLNEIGILANYLEIPFDRLIKGATGWAKDNSPVSTT